MRLNKNEIFAAFRHVCESFSNLPELREALKNDETSLVWNGVIYRRVCNLPEINGIKFDVLVLHDNYLYLNPSDSTELDREGFIRISFESFFSGCCFSPERIYQKFANGVRKAVQSYTKKSLNFRRITEDMKNILSIEVPLYSKFSSIKNKTTIPCNSPNDEKTVPIDGEVVEIFVNDREYELYFKNMAVRFVNYNGVMLKKVMQFNTEIRRKGSKRILHKLSTNFVRIDRDDKFLKTSLARFYENLDKFLFKDLRKNKVTMSNGIKAKYSY